jgi:dTDP-4-amino-4,6-dideoxygalactose transaminase
VTRPTGYVPFNRPYVTGCEFAYMQEAIDNAHIAGNGAFSRRCCECLERMIGSRRVLLTHSCTGALEMAFTLANISPGDEVVMPSFTFVSTANAVVERGGTPVFVDIRDDTLCIDASLIESALTEKTRAIAPVHYAAVASDMDAISKIAAEHDLIVVEDAAQAIRATLDGRPLGGIGELGALSFHETKNVNCGEGGALLVNDERFVERAEIVHEKGTDRQRFFRGVVDKYTWVDAGSSYPLSDLAAAYLWGQLEHIDEITSARLTTWNRYHEAFAPLEAAGRLRRPVIPETCRHNGHMYYLLVDSAGTRTALIDELARRRVNAVFHYVPLHSSAGGARYGRAIGDLTITDRVSERLVRLPLWVGMTEAEVSQVVEGVFAFYANRASAGEPILESIGRTSVAPAGEA